LFRVVLDGPPEVRHHTVKVIHGFTSALVVTGPLQENRTAPKEGLNVVRHVTEPLPDQIGNCTLAAEPRERSF
jgi:hypothetical protein